MAIVLCSIALLAGSLVFWKLSFPSALVGLAIGLSGLFGRFG